MEEHIRGKTQTAKLNMVSLNA